MTNPLRAYKDLNLSFIAHPNSGDIAVLSGPEAVKRSVRNLVLTNYYERFFQPKLGSGVTYYQFENADSVTAFNLRTAIIQVINTREPRAKILDVLVHDESEQNGFNIKIIFSVDSISEPLTVSFFLERVR